MHYYNEHDPKAAAWLRQLIAAGHLPPGNVDTRDIQLVQPDDLLGYTQCHFFAGIGGWALALQLAGVPTTTRLWTGSCPCQPFSVAGKGLGKKDPRHLWPHFRRLIRQCRPPVVFGEQVASAAGRDWLSGVCADLEALAYRAAGSDLCAAGGPEDCTVGILRGDTLTWEPATLSAPHIRQRLYWCAGNLRVEIPGSQPTRRQLRRPGQSPRPPALRPPDQSGGPSCACGPRQRLADPDEGQCRRLPVSQFPSLSAWSDFSLIPCRDGKTRRIESGTFPLAHGIPGRVGLLRGYGNAIVPQTAAHFITAAIDALSL